MPQYIAGTCRTCTTRIRIPTEERDIGTLQQVLAERRGYSCPGKHVELGIMLDGYDWDWTPFSAAEPATDLEYGHALLTRYPGRLYYLGDPGLGESLGIPSLHNLKDLEHVAFGDFANAEWYFQRHDSPRGTTRFYIQERR